MHRLTTGYARYFNERHGHVGHVFQNRYGSRLLEGDEDLATVVVYIARNPLEAGLGMRSNHTIGRSHSSADKQEYHRRIEAINFSMAHDDGASHRDLADADVILVGVSRSGKTPTSLYLALQFGLKAANYPLIPEDFERNSLPEVLKGFRQKLYGLSIAPERLREIRQERRPDSAYAKLSNCRFEVEQAEAMMRREGIRWVNSTTKSIEEIATTVLRDIKIERHVF